MKNRLCDWDLSIIIWVKHFYSGSRIDGLKFSINVVFQIMCNKETWIIDIILCLIKQLIKGGNSLPLYPFQG